MSYMYEDRMIHDPATKFLSLALDILLCFGLTLWLACLGLYSYKQNATNRFSIP